MVVNGLRSNTKNLVHYIMMNVYVQLKYEMMHISQQAQNLKTAAYQCQRNVIDVDTTLFLTTCHRINVDTTLFCDGMVSH